MKDDIDSILNSMFRGGRLQVKGSDPQKGGEDPLAQADKAMEELQKVNLDLSKKLGEDVERLTREAQRDLEDLEQHLRKDGVEAKSAGNGGDPQELERAFAQAEKEAGEQVLYQEEFLSTLRAAFQRPFVSGSGEENRPLCRAAVLGAPGTGRHTAVCTMTQALGRRGVLKSTAVHTVNLSAYNGAGTEKLFFQDLYAALKSGAGVLVFEKPEACHPTVLSLFSKLIRAGEIALPGRYAEQKGTLVEVGNAMVPHPVSSLSVRGKYLFLLSDGSRESLSGLLGAPFLGALDDVCETRPLSQEAKEAIGERTLKALEEKAEKRLGIALSWGEGERKALAESAEPNGGAKGIIEYGEKLFRLLSEEKLKTGRLPAQGMWKAENGSIVLEYEAEGEKRRLAQGADGGEEARETALQAVKQELSQIVGLHEIKEHILSLEDHVKIQEMRREKGLKADPISLHMIFTGNPGTGKTTVARLAAKYLKALGVLAGGQLIEVTRGDLVGRYVGHTAPLTQKAMDAALGGVLFIDEAYSLYRGKDDSFGLEAIDTLVKGMEDHRDSLVVILAGYTREMEDFLTANSGLRSRFPNIMEFPDYTPEELWEITGKIASSMGYRLDPSCKEPLLSTYTEKQNGGARENGNGRMARNKVEEAVIAASRRNLREPEEKRDLELLLPVDFGFSTGSGE